MIWFFERHGRYLRFETRAVENHLGHYELVRVLPDGTELVERFDDADALLQRQIELEAEFMSDGWQGPYGRFF